MRLRLELADPTLASLDALDVDTLAAFVGTERPLSGLPSLLDWRLAGAVSRAILDGLVTPEHGEALLLPSAGKLRAGRVVLFGLDDPSPRSVTMAVRRGCEALHRAGAWAVGVGLPGGASPAVVARAWLEPAAVAGFARQVLLGDARALGPALEAAGRELGISVEVVRSPARTEAPTG